MKIFMRALLITFVLGFFSFLFYYSTHQDMGVLDPKGIIGIAEKNLLITALLLMLIVIIPVFAMLGAFVWRYREGNTKAKYSPDWHGSIPLEIAWWTIPSVIVIILSFITWQSTHDLDPYKPLLSDKKQVTIQVIALDWKWLFIYPEEHIATVNYIALPKDTPIHFEITADAPMNAFWIPKLGTQVYAMPGMTAQLNLMGNEEGEYKGMSSNFSGDGFSGMKFTARVASDEGYQEWLHEVRLSGSTLTEYQYEKLRKQSKNNPVKYYASVDEKLYTKVIMKFMGQDGATHDMSHGDMGMPDTGEVPLEMPAMHEMETH